MFEFAVEASSGSARVARFTTPRISFKTPVFMPVGTRGAVRLLPMDSLQDMGYQVLLSNTYHLMLRPGAQIIKDLGGLAVFNGWQGATLTDSGGFQVMSLGAKFSDDGVKFKSVYDGSHEVLTPERAVEVQEYIGADIAMVLDVCTMLPANSETLARNMALTHSWAQRSREAKRSDSQAQFAIVQGGTDRSLREESVGFLTAIPFEGYAIGGLAVGESRELTLETIATVAASLPADKPRYLMGVGDPYTLVHAISLGVDMFDCVAPSRLGRHGIALTSIGKVSVKSALYRESPQSLDPACKCSTCLRYPMAFINHLYKVDSYSAGALLTRHNLTFMADLLRNAREAITLGRLEMFVREIDLYWS